ncbi:MAG TPA: hypothetical protein VII31_07705 [Caldimonas sp.]
MAFDGGGTADAEVSRDAAKAPAAVVTPRLEPELLRAAAPIVEVANGWRESQTWQPSTGGLVRRVETAVIVAICAYFALGLAGVAGWF